MSDLSEPTCGDCQAFYMEGKDELGVVRGLCHIRSELGELPANMPYCHVFRVRDSRIGFVKAVEPKKKTRTQRSRNVRNAPLSEPKATMEEPTIGDTQGDITMDRDGLKQVLREILEEETLFGYPSMGMRWNDGTLILKPVSEDNQPKEIPIEAFFHKIVMLRDRLRVLEAKINGHKKLEEQDKVELQGYISKCYGTMTTFNILFGDKEDHFRSK
ncbi:MAG: hypothetical protein GY854_18585 [Deltaproteobacteria bacterium]|nr:hypothetical protein [Deltaproteobacteria bacterium]